MMWWEELEVLEEIHENMCFVKAQKHMFSCKCLPPLHHSGKELLMLTTHPVSQELKHNYLHHNAMTSVLF